MGAIQTVRQLSLVFTAVAALSACSEIPSWAGGSPAPIKRAPGERVDVVTNPSALAPDATAQDVQVEVPEQTNLAEWHTKNEAMLTAHIGLTGVTKEKSATIGDGNSFSRNTVSPPVTGAGMVFAMDAAGIVSAHSEADIDDVKWIDKTGRMKHERDALGGGLAFADNVLYVTTGFGNVRAIDVATGKPKWTISAGAPVRGAPAVADGLVVVLTADNQTLAYEAATGAVRWEHRGIRESAGYFATTSPVISEGIVIAAYSSGEVFAIRADSGSVLWNDTLASGVRTKAAAVFSGIDADPIVQDGVVVVTSASGEMQASALLNGRPLWQQRLGAHQTPWSAGNVLYALSDTHDIAAILKRDGGVRWATSMAVKDDKDPNKDLTPPLFGPILSANAVLVVDGDGKLTSFKPTDGTRIGSYDLTSGIVAAPIVANGAMYVVTKDAKLHKFY